MNPAAWRRFLGRKRVVLAFTLFLTLESAYWTTYSRRHDPLLPCLCAGSRGYHPAIPYAVVVETGSTLQILDRYDPEAERVRDNPGSGEAVIADIMSIPQSRTTGLFAPVIRRIDHTMHIMPHGRPLTPAELATVRSLYSVYLKNQWPWAGPRSQEHAALLAVSDGVTRRILWGGLLHDVFASAVVALWLWSLWLIFIAPDIALGRAERRRW